MLLSVIEGVRGLHLRRSVWPAYALVAVVVALPVATLVGAFAFDTALEKQAIVRFSRDVAASKSEARPLRSATTRTLDDGVRVEVILLSPGTAELDWPGLPTVPVPGAVYLSRSLATRGDEIPQLVPEIQADSVMLALPEALMSEPGEAVVVAAVPAWAMPSNARNAGEWGMARDGVAVQGRILLPVVLGLLLPSLAIFRAASEFLIVVNQERWSVLRLLGVQRRHVLMASASLMFVLCLPGLVLTKALLGSLGLLGRSVSFGTQAVFVENLKVTTWQLVQVASLVVLVVVISALWSSRDIVLDPLSVRQRVVPRKKPFAGRDASLMAAAVALAASYQRLVDRLGDFGGGLLFAILLIVLSVASVRLCRLLLHFACAWCSRAGLMATMFARNARHGASGLDGLLKALAVSAFFCGFALVIAATVRQEPATVDLRIFPFSDEQPVAALVDAIEGIDGVAQADLQHGSFEIVFSEGLAGRQAVESKIVGLFDGGVFIDHVSAVVSEQDIADSRLRATIAAAVAATLSLMLCASVVYTLAMLNIRRQRFSMLYSYGLPRRDLVRLGLFHLLVPLGCFGAAPLIFGLGVGTLVRDPPAPDVPLVAPSTMTVGWAVGLVVLSSIGVVCLAQMTVKPEVPRSFD